MEPLNCCSLVRGTPHRVRVAERMGWCIGMVEGSEVDHVFFFQAEDGIRDYKVTGVQTCALPIFDACCAKIRCPEGNPASSATVFSDLASCAAKLPRYSGCVSSCKTRATTRRPLESGDRKSVV